QLAGIVLVEKAAVCESRYAVRRGSGLRQLREEPEQPEQPAEVRPLRRGNDERDALRLHGRRAGRQRTRAPLARPAREEVRSASEGVSRKQWGVRSEE